jgi:hypothetical protein
MYTSPATKVKVELHDMFRFDGNDADTTPDDGWQSEAYNDQNAGSGMPLGLLCHSGHKT